MTTIDDITAAGPGSEELLPALAASLNVQRDTPGTSANAGRLNFPPKTSDVPNPEAQHASGPITPTP